MEAHKDKFSEDETVCLARVFTNVELLGEHPCTSLPYQNIHKYI
jgi:hypothetical protein